MTAELLIAFKVCLVVLANSFIIWGVMALIDENSELAIPPLLEAVYKICGIIALLAFVILATGMLSYLIWQINIKTV